MFEDVLLKGRCLADMSEKKRKSYNDYELCKDITQSELTTAQIAEESSGRIQGSREMSGAGRRGSGGRRSTERGRAQIHGKLREIPRKCGRLGITFQLE